jgi:hypothetical protein
MRRLLLLVSMLSLLLISGAQAAQATAASGTFHWDAGAGVVCGVEETACPNIARASNGDTFSLRAQGDFNTANGAASVGAGSTFEHKNSAGTLLATGTLTAAGLLTFIPYGCGGGPFPPNFCGGRAALAVHLVAHPASNPSATVEADGILEVECLIGNPPAGAMEGIRMNVKDRINFNKSAGGDTLFIKTS